MSSSPSPGYDVFLSFRGCDTRKTIVSHLYEALVNKGISTFKDDEEIGLGDSIPEKLCEAIESSRFAVVVISERYAFSKFCLEELRLIMELKSKKEIGVIPVFYDVKPSDVKNLERKFALTRHQSLKMADKWKAALRRIGNQKGTESSKCKDDATMVEDIVKLISKRLLSVLPMDLRNLKALIVLDDVDDASQLYALAREATWFGPGSRIIITTRDKSLLSDFGVRYEYKVKYLDDDNALQLFHRIAFQGGKLPSSIGQDLSTRVSRLARGLPVALMAIGSCLREKSPEGWKDALISFEEAPCEKMMKKLIISYDKLGTLGKTAFLHVACLFNGDNVSRVMTLLEQGEYWIQVLANNSLIDISADGSIAMHRLLEQLGRQIVRHESSNNPAQQRILWHHADIYRVLADNAGTSITEAMALDVSVMFDDFYISWNVFQPMHNLNFLNIYNHTQGSRSNIPRDAENLLVPQKLRLLHWDSYPYTTLPSSILPDCLVELKLCYSKLRTLWSGTPRLLHLRKLDMTGSNDLKELPDLQKAVRLEELILEGCTSLKRIPKSIHSLSRLQKIDVSNCDGLKKLWIKITESKGVFQDTSLSVRSVYLKFVGTEADSQGIFLENPSIKGNLKIDLKLLKGNAEHLFFVSEKQIPSESPPYSFKSLDIMRFNCSKKKGHFKCISFTDFPWMTELNLINLNIEKIPDDIHQMRILEKLDLSGNSFKGLPTTMNLLTKLKYLTLFNCCNLEELPELHQLERLTLSDCTNLRTLMKLNQGRYRLLELWLDNCKNIESLSDELRHFTKLTYLDLSRHNFETLPTSIMNLTSLVTLCISYCNNLVSLTALPPSLKCLNAHGCKSLETSSLPIIHSVDLTPCPHWKESSHITRFPAGRCSKEVPVCACFQETTIPNTDYQVTISILLQRLKPWMWAFAWCIFIVGLAILHVGLAILLTSGIDPFPPLLLVILIYLNIIIPLVINLYHCKKLTFL